MLLLSLQLSACTDRQPLRVSLSPWIGYESLNLANEFGWLPANVRLARVETMDESVAALKAGQVDAAAMTLDQMLLARAQGDCFTAAAVFNVSAGGDMILARPHFEGLDELEGRRIGLLESTLSYLVLGKALETVDLKLTDVEAVELQGKDPVVAWADGRLDAIVIYEPAATILRRQGARRVFDTRRLPDLIFDVLVVPCASRRDQTMRGVLEAHFRAIDYIRDHTHDAGYRIAANENLAFSDVQEMLGGVALPSLQANRRYLRADSALLRAAAEIAAFLHASGVLPVEDELRQLVDARFLPERH